MIEATYLSVTSVDFLRTTRRYVSEYGNRQGISLSAEGLFASQEGLLPFMSV